MKAIKKIKSGVLVIAMLSILAACNNSTADKTGYKGPDEVGMAAVNDAGISEKKYLSLKTSKTASEKEFNQTLNEISENLSLINISAGLLKKPEGKTGEKISVRKKEEILHNISLINSVLEKNRSRIKSLNARLASYNADKQKWTTESALLKTQIEQLQLAISTLQDKLKYETQNADQLTEKVNDLQLNNQALTDQNKRMDADAHKAYYALGTYKELKKNNVLKKTGGVLGLGKVQELKPDLNKGYFTQIDYRKLTSIPIHAHKAKVVTHHPIESFELRKEEKDMLVLNIIDADKFWSDSRYLVVEVEK